MCASATEIGMTDLLSITGLRKSVARRPLFDIDHFTLATGTAYVLTGANGAGKSTLLRILGGLEPPDEAEVSFLGQPIKLWPYPAVMREAVVYVHQHPVMFSTSVAGNIGYGLSARGLSKDEITQRVEEAMAWAGVQHLRRSSPIVLSGGEKQRIALARAKVLQPRLLLLDEPTSNLDGAAREQVIALVPDLISTGSSVVMACHDRDLIGLPGMHRLKLRDGHLEQR
jgi:tungstate transport system ATP-binding protein